MNQTAEQPKPKYDPYSYWYDRGMDYKVLIDTTEEVNCLAETIVNHGLQGANILEIGSGHGRIFLDLKERNIINPALFAMCDFVDPMRFRCLQATGKLPDKWDGHMLPYSRNEFDLVISFSVMLHVPPEDILRHFQETIRVSKKYIFIATCLWSGIPLAKHCFIHDYVKLAEDAGLEFVTAQSFKYDEGKTERINWILKKSQ